MFTRLFAIIGLFFVLVVGAVSVAQSPAPPVAVAPVEPAPFPPAVQGAAPLPPPVEIAPPVAINPPIMNAPPVVATPPEPAPTPVVTAPPEPAPTPAVAVPTPMPPAKPETAEDKLPAKQLFSHVTLPSLGHAMAIGYYPRGCLQGGVPLPVTGPTWQVMHLERNRNWGHPSLVKFLEKFAPLAAKVTGWKGILVGDMAQPRGGPLPFGHMSHQIGLDVDIWFMPMPDRVLSKDERQNISAINLVSDDWKHLNPKTWTPQHIAFIKTAAEQPDVERVLVNAAIKQELCRVEDKKNDGWMSKIRPWYGHHDHIHVRLKCPADSPNCRKQPPVPGDDSCSAKSLEYWFSDKVLHPKPKPPGPPAKPITLADLPPACKNVLDAPAKPTDKASAE